MSATVLKVTKFLEIFSFTPVDGPTTNVWYKAVPVGRNTLAKQVKTIASIASLDGKLTNPDSISSYSHNPLEKLLRMSNKLAGFSSSNATTVTAANASGSLRTEALCQQPCTSISCLQ